MQSVQSFTCSVSSGTAGDIGLTLLRRLTPMIPLSTQSYVMDMYTARMGRLLDPANGACPR